MSAELNLTDDQMRRIGAAKSPEEKARIITEGMEGVELSDEQLDAVSGGNVYKIPATHAEIDVVWDTIQGIYDRYGKDVAAIAAYDSGLIPMEGNLDIGNYFDNKSISTCRANMHARLDGTALPYSG